MSSKIVVRGGEAHAVYDDRYRCIFEALGKMEVSRASEVDYYKGVWIARLVSSGEVVAVGTDRRAVIASEVEYLESRLY